MLSCISLFFLRLTKELNEFEWKKYEFEKRQSRKMIIQITGQLSRKKDGIM